jgi:DNA-binding MarR family transcriptional regulator
LVPANGLSAKPSFGMLIFCHLLQKMPDKNDKAETGTLTETEEPVDLGLLPELIGYHLRKAQLAVFQDFARTVGAGELTPAQFAALVVIERNPGLSQTGLGQTLSIDRSTLVAIIDRLEARSLVKRADSPRDRRSYALHISSAGRDLLGELTSRVRTHEAHIAGDLDADEKAVLVGLLSRIRRPAA